VTDLDKCDHCDKVAVLWHNERTGLALCESCDHRADNVDPLPEGAPTVYLTAAQIHRLGGIACDALVGLQLHTDANDRTVVLIDMVDVDNPSRSRHFTVDPDGAYRETT
jgi:hypothetical protein